MAVMGLDPELLKRLSLIRSFGFNPEGEDFHEQLGLEKSDFQFLTRLVEEIESEARNLLEAFKETYEVTKYAEDEIVKAFLMFHLGAIYGRNAALKTFEIADKEIFTKGYKQGFSDGFKSGFEKGFEMSKYVEKITKKEKNT
ncbi:MAG: hypothetical protein DSZ31_00350 [Gammaproteobacteria bacterium]|nr:MAG: hypothetical protein DSZ31_00350 [Gammaproteobacteria bacterium]RTZ70232.1 MAG: hypothetical protein DSZ30_01120 [Aquificaceae bacterium]